MRTLVLPDAHLDRPDAPAVHALIALLDQPGAERVVLAGDLLHAGWTWKGRLPPAFDPLWAAMQRALARGTRLAFVPGNHDFALAGALARLGLDVNEELHFIVGERRWLVVHGDQADESQGYRLSRRLLRGRAFAGLMGALGPRKGQRLIAGLAGSSRAHAKDGSELVQAQLAWADQRLGQGIDAVAMGHGHALGLHRRPGGPVALLGDWTSQRSLLEIDGQAAVLWRGVGAGRAVVDRL